MQEAVHSSCVLKMVQDWGMVMLNSVSRLGVAVVVMECQVVIHALLLVFLGVCGSFGEDTE
jgi:hypothetical protein